jgi:DNA-binding GntR family transcriptional regulator
MIVRRRGVGTRVVQPKVRRPLELTSLYDDLAGSGRAPTTKVLSFATVPADDAVLEALAHDGKEVVKVVRLRSTHENPIAQMTNYLPPALVDFDSVALEEHGLYELLRARGIQLHSATQSVGARKATTTEATLLREPRGAALLTMQRVTYDDHGSVVEYGTHIYAASRYAFEINLLSH